jgi:hypothetical protein
MLKLMLIFRRDTEPLNIKKSLCTGARSGQNKEAEMKQVRGRELFGLLVFAVTKDELLNGKVSSISPPYFIHTTTAHCPRDLEVQMTKSRMDILCCCHDKLSSSPHS